MAVIWLLFSWMILLVEYILLPMRMKIIQQQLQQNLWFDNTRRYKMTRQTRQMQKHTITKRDNFGAKQSHSLSNSNKNITGYKEKTINEIFDEKQPCAHTNPNERHILTSSPIIKLP
mmetsp:Transcript_60979/g.73313  ORF Transcript_60979/g.73313 Transcript_60979/m.73313 type:complete len:117 (-) Transcript_60979:107-457(-)